MAFWLMKSEPGVYAITDLERDGHTAWNGVRNYQVRNMMRDVMRVGDRAFFWHSNCSCPGIAGTLVISGAARPDPTQFDPRSPGHDPASRPDAPRWLLVDVAFERRFAVVIPLSRLRGIPALARMPVLQRGNRLSITPVTDAEWRTCLALADA